MHLQAGYLAKAGKSVAVFERREILGGAAVTEEIIPGIAKAEGPCTPLCKSFTAGFKFSRASYLLSLLRPQIVKDLELKVNVFSHFNHPICIFLHLSPETRAQGLSEGPQCIYSSAWH